jgi:hypothetical protein
MCWPLGEGVLTSAIPEKATVGEPSVSAVSFPRAAFALAEVLSDPLSRGVSVSAVHYSMFTLSGQDHSTGRVVYQAGLEGLLSDGVPVEVSDSPQPGRFCLNHQVVNLLTALRKTVPFPLWPDRRSVMSQTLWLGAPHG